MRLSIEVMADRHEQEELLIQELNKDEQNKEDVKELVGGMLLLLSIFFTFYTFLWIFH